MSDPINLFYSALGRYPGNNKQWWSARAPTDDDTAGVKQGDFLPAVLDKSFTGNMLAPRGHFVLEAFNKDRSAVSGVADLPVEKVRERPPTVAFFSGRAWFACESTVYYSQLLTDKTKAGLCYQEADPTSEEISEPIATDGGVIPIPEANKIIRLMPKDGGIMVLALNGVWYITGTSSGFSALDISVNKVSPIGCRSPHSIVDTEGPVFWWSDVGIMGATQASGQFGPIPGRFERTNIAETTIQTLYNDISNPVKEDVRAVYDQKANTILWLYRDDDFPAGQYNRVLLYDLSLQAFYPWKFSEIGGDTGPKVKGFYRSERTAEYGVTTDIPPTQIEFLVVEGDRLRVAQTNSKQFVDWYSYDSVGVNYDSFIETGYELFDDAMRDKNITYLFTYLKRTEEEWVGGKLDYPSSCEMTVKFDWASGSHSGKWTTPIQVYRHSKTSFSPDTGFGLVISKNKIRGNGKSLQFRFGTSEAGKDFDLHGWSIAVSGNTTP